MQLVASVKTESANCRDFSTEGTAYQSLLIKKIQCEATIGNTFSPRNVKKKTVRQHPDLKNQNRQCPLCSITGLTRAIQKLRITRESPENFNPDNDNQEVPNNDVTNFFKKRTPTLNRVPKGARQSLAELFQKLLTELLRDPTDASKWPHLLTMPKQCFKQPTRGGKKYNLMAHVRKQKTDFSYSEGLTRISENGPSHPATKRESSLNSRVSKKMDAGDVKEQYGQCAQTTALLQTQRKP